MRLPNRPTSIAELKERIDSGEFRESRVLEFKRQFPKKNEDTARGIAGLAAEGGVLVIGVAEEQGGLHVAPLDCNGARERAEQIARDIPKPPVQVESHILGDDVPGRGVLWIEIPASEALLHQIDGTYYTRDDTQTRPMSDAEVAYRMKLREDRGGPIGRALEDALAREEPAAPSLHGRTCIVACPIGADAEEFYESTRDRAAWESFASKLQSPAGVLLAVPDRYWGLIGQHVVSQTNRFSSSLDPSRYRDIEIQRDGAFSYLSYSQDWHDPGRVSTHSALRACSDSLALLRAVQDRTGQRHAWDLLFSISGVKGRRAWVSLSYFPPPLDLPIPRDRYSEPVLGISTDRLENDRRGVIEELAAHFVAACGLEFEDEWRRAVGQ